MKKGNMKVSTSMYKKYFLYVLLLVLPSCGRVVDWVKDSFPQIPSLSASCSVIEKYSKSITLYDQFTTRAKFDALWLADDVRALYVDLFSLKFGKTVEQKKALLRRQLEENNHFIAFYVLSFHEVPLGDTSSEWALFLQINGKNYSPIEVKTVELSPEYICLFGKKYNRFKVAYSVKFDAKDIDDIPLITASTDEMKLYFRSTTKEVVFVWDIPQPMVSCMIKKNDEAKENL
jgi:hypothetical protein